MLQIEVIYATQEMQQPIVVSMTDGATVQQAIEASRVTQIYPEILERPLVVGIYGEIVRDPSTYKLQDGDRVEIYRPLQVDPKEARRRRAGKSA